MNEEVERLKWLIKQGHNSLVETMEQGKFTVEFMLENYGKISGYENKLKAIVGWQEAGRISREVQVQGIEDTSERLRENNRKLYERLSEAGFTFPSRRSSDGSGDTKL